MSRADTQEGAQLGLQHLGVLEQQSNSTLRKRRVARPGQGKVRELFVPAHIQQTQHNLARMHALGGALEQLVLLLLRRKCVAN